VPHALAVLFTVARVPSVYAGDEYGWTGVKEQRLGGDDAVRPEFPPRPPDAATVECGTGRLTGGRVQLPARGWAVLTA
jgi:hypothetical protein